MSSTNRLLPVLAAATFCVPCVGVVNAQAVASPPAAAMQIAPNLPRVSSLTLTPTGPKRAALGVAFSRAERLPDSIPLSGLALTLRRKAGVSNEFSAELSFDFEEFTKEQERRAELARRGALTAIFEGRQIVRVVRVPFIDPALLRRLIAARRPIIIPANLFKSTGTGTPIARACEPSVTPEQVCEIAILRLLTRRGCRRRAGQLEGAGAELPSCALRDRRTPPRTLAKADGQGLTPHPLRNRPPGGGAVRRHP